MKKIMNDLIVREIKKCRFKDLDDFDREWGNLRERITYRIDEYMSQKGLKGLQFSVLEVLSIIAIVMVISMAIVAVKFF